MGNLEEKLSELTPTRIAIYDDYLAAPRIVDVEPKEITLYIEEITVKTYELSQQKGGTIPYTTIREACENFIHAQFKNPCISIMDNGNTIKFTDQGPGIPDKALAQQPGVTSATPEMRKYIRGVGSGFKLIKEYLQTRNGRLIIEDNIKEGTVITIKAEQGMPFQTTTTPREVRAEKNVLSEEVNERLYSILVLAQELGQVGPTELRDNLDLSLSTGYRELGKLETMGFLQKVPDGTKRVITNQGISFLNS